MSSRIATRNRVSLSRKSPIAVAKTLNTETTEPTEINNEQDLSALGELCVYLFSCVTVSAPCSRLPGMPPTHTGADPPAYCAKTLKVCQPGARLFIEVVKDQFVIPTKPVLFDKMY